METAVENEINKPETVWNENAEELSELVQPIWSVISFEAVAVSGLTYQEAQIWLRKLKNQNVSGLCIITDEAASRFL